MNQNKFPFGIKNFGIQINTICNGHCDYCRFFRQDTLLSDRQYYMKSEVLSQFYQQLCSNPIDGDDYYNIWFLEAEPTLSFDLITQMFKIYPITRENGFFHSIVTNGKLLTPQMLDFLVKYQIITRISLDGTPENCLKQKGVDYYKLRQVCRTCADPSILSFSYVITKERFQYLEEDLEYVFDIANEFNCEWSYLLNVLDKWPEHEFDELTHRLTNFILKHNNPLLNNDLNHHRITEDCLLGLHLKQNGDLITYPASHSCRFPIDETYLNQFKKAGTIYQPNKNIIQNYIAYYGQEGCNTQFQNEHNKCPSCNLIDQCQKNKNGNIFILSDEDCQANQYHERIIEEMEKKEFNYEEAKKDFYIHSVCLGLTNQCNMRCRYCFTHHEEKHMDLATAIASVMWIKENRGDIDETHINFFGGEPMLHYEDIIVPLVEWTEKSGIPGITFGMTTNATLLNEDRIKWLADHDVSLLLSMDGGPETQNYNRVLLNGKNSFDEVVKHIPSLLAYNRLLCFRATVLPATVKNLYQDYLWADAFGFRYYYCMPDDFSEWTDENKNDFVENLRNIYWTMYHRLDEGKQVPIMDDFFEVMHRLICDQGPIRKDKPYLRCGLGTVGVGIAYNGDLYGCQEHLTYDHSSPFWIGNIFDGGFDENRRERLVSMYMSGNPTNIPTCPSHSWGVCHDVNKEPEIHRIWRETTELTVLEILQHDAKYGSGKFFDFVTNHHMSPHPLKRRGEEDAWK